MGSVYGNNDYIELKFLSDSKNESFARAVVAAYITRLNPTLEEINDVKTAVSEAVTNSIVHGYANTTGEIEIKATINGNIVDIWIKDRGCGIEDVNKAREALFTTRPQDERSGMGFTFMELFMDSLFVVSDENGTVVHMSKRIGE